MFTVIIADKKVLKSVDDYGLFLKPFIDPTKLKFCKWNYEGNNLDAMVPDLVNTIAEEESWRAIIIAPAEGLTKKNPFDLVSYNAKERKSYEVPIEWEADQIREALDERIEFNCKLKAASLAEASKKPLVRLCTYLCEQPLVEPRTNKKKVYDCNDEEVFNPDFEEYEKNEGIKYELRKQILGDEPKRFNYPTDVICVAERTYVEEQGNLESYWTPHTNFQYTKFFDWNMYFDKMRFLVYDIVPKTHKAYPYENIKFLYSMLILASNPIPASSMLARRIYSLNCQNDNDALAKLLVTYDQKLLATDDYLREVIQSIKDSEIPRLSDEEVEANFCTETTISAAIDEHFKRDDLQAKCKAGIVTDAPSSEADKWEASYAKSKETLFEFLKQPKRALKKASADTVREGKLPDDKCSYLNGFQSEDLQDFIHGQEYGMVDVLNQNEIDPAEFEREMSRAKKEVDDKIDMRMNRRQCIIISAIVLGIVVLSCIPMLVSNFADFEARATAGTIMLIECGIFALGGIVCLFFLRKALNDKINDFNDVMKGIARKVDDGMDLFSSFLSKLCSAMRGNSVVNYGKEHESVDEISIRVYSKHRSDIKNYREQLHNMFAMFLPNEAKYKKNDQLPYNFDFRSSADYVYPVPFMEHQSSEIEFITKGNMVHVPVNYISKMSLTMEDIYE